MDENNFINYREMCGKKCGIIFVYLPGENNFSPCALGTCVFKNLKHPG